MRRSNNAYAPRIASHLIHTDLFLVVCPYYPFALVKGFLEISKNHFPILTKSRGYGWLYALAGWFHGKYTPGYNKWNIDFMINISFANTPCPINIVYTLGLSQEGGFNRERQNTPDINTWRQWTY